MQLATGLAEDSFALMQLFVQGLPKDSPLLGFGQRLWGEMDTTLCKLGKVRSVCTPGQEGICILRCQPDRESPGTPLPRERTQETRFTFLWQQQMRLVHEKNHLQWLYPVLDRQCAV